MPVKMSTRKAPAVMSAVHHGCSVIAPHTFVVSRSHGVSPRASAGTAYSRTFRSGPGEPSSSNTAPPDAMDGDRWACCQAARLKRLARARAGSPRSSCRAAPVSAQRRSFSRSTQWTPCRSPHSLASRVKLPLVMTTA